MSFFRNNFCRLPDGEKGKGLGRWFQILEESFTVLFKTNLITIVPLFPSVISFWVMWKTGDLRCGLIGLLLFICAGPAVAALNFICMKKVLDIPVWLTEDYKECIRKKWKPAMLLSVIVSVFWAVFLYAVNIVVTVEKGLPFFMLLLFLVYGYLLTGFTILAYQQVAMVELKLKYILKNAVLLIFAGRGRSFFMIVFMDICVILSAIYTFWGSVLLLSGSMAVGVMTADLIFQPEFEKYFYICSELEENSEEIEMARKS